MLDNFDAVWERVSGAAAPPEPGADNSRQRETLRAFMDDEYADCRLYTALSQKCPAYSRALTQMAADEKRHLKRHKLEYFLLYGDCYYPSPAAPAVCGILSSLRQAFLDENAACEAYLKAADETGDKALERSYRDFAEDEERHARTLRQIIERSL